MTHDRRSTDHEDDSDHRTFEERIEAVIGPQLAAMGEHFRDALRAHEHAQVAARDAAAATMATVLARLDELGGEVAALPDRIRRLEQAAHDERVSKAAVDAYKAETTGVRPSPLVVTTTAHPGGPADVSTIYPPPRPIADGVGKLLVAVSENIRVIAALVSIIFGASAASIQAAMYLADDSPATMTAPVEVDGE